jgi:hypothetical protein
MIGTRKTSTPVLRIFPLWAAFAGEEKDPVSTKMGTDRSKIALVFFEQETKLSVRKKPVHLQ